MVRRKPKLNKKLILIVFCIIIFTAITVLIYTEKSYSETYFELAVWPDGAGHTYPDPGLNIIWHRFENRAGVNFVHHYVLRYNRTLVRYTGISRNYYRLGNRDFMRTLNVSERRRAVLSEEDFQNVSEMIWKAVSAERNGTANPWNSQARAAFFYEGNIYRGYGGITDFTKALENEFRRLMD